MLSLATTVILFAFCLMVIYGALSDLSAFKIPNWVSYGLVALFALHEFVVWLNTPYMPSLEFRLPHWTVNAIISLIVFVVCTIFWKLRFIGGGDVKFLTATSLWMGVQYFVIFMVLLTGLALLFVAILKFMNIWGPFFQGSRLPNFLKRALQKAEVNELPYGLPIGIAALILIPGMMSQVG